VSNLYLRATTQAAMLSALDAAGLVIGGQPQSVTIHASGNVTDCYVIGVMYDGATEIPGYHANVRTTEPAVIAKLQPLTCAVNSPSFVFA